jgi:hypothetical protein
MLASSRWRWAAQGVRGCDQDCFTSEASIHQGWLIDKSIRVQVMNEWTHPTCLNFNGGTTARLSNYCASSNKEPTYFRPN